MWRFKILPNGILHPSPTNQSSQHLKTTPSHSMSPTPERLASFRTHFLRTTIPFNVPRVRKLAVKKTVRSVQDGLLEGELGVAPLWMLLQQSDDGITCMSGDTNVLRLRRRNLRLEKGRKNINAWKKKLSVSKWWEMGRNTISSMYMEIL